MNQSAPPASPETRPSSASGAETIGMVLGVLLLPFLLIAALAGAIPAGQEVSSPRFARTRSGKIKRWKR